MTDETPPHAAARPEGPEAGVASDARPATSDGVHADYLVRAAEHARRRDALAARAERLSYARLAAFAAAAGTGLAALGGQEPGPLLAAAALAAVVAFVGLARAHAARSRLARWVEVRRRVCERGALRVARAWSELGPDDTPPRDAAHPYAADLDITGPASLARLLDVTSVDPGRRTVAAWLLDAPPTATALRERQRAVAELTAAREWRETLTAHAWAAGARAAPPPNVDRFLRWAEGEPWLTRRPVVIWAARILPVLIIPITALGIGRLLVAVGALPAPGPLVAAAMDVVRGWWALPLVAGIALTVSAGRKLTRGLTAATAQAGGLAAYAAMLAHVEASPFTGDALTAIRRRLGTGRGAARELTRLSAIVRWAETRYSPMAYAVLQVVLLWDFHVLEALERWQRDAGTHARDWLAALGEAEALSALATLAYDNPDWSLPELSDGGPVLIDARGLGHPLLAAAVRVDNDVRVGPPGTFLLVTGSNMSGKSTLLRAIGTNVVLAQAGGPVCATSLRAPVLDLWTSIRIDDSLEAGISLFMAELRRLKRIVDAARDPARPRPLLYLLDEMLHGTNTAERRIAARTVLAHLVHAGALGAITTHDLTLAEDPSLDAAARRVHFTEQFEPRDGKTVMTFDYRLRPGLATSANALRLLEMIGLGDDSRPAPASE